METNNSINKIVGMCRKARAASLVLFCICLAAGACCIFSTATALPDLKQTVRSSTTATLDTSIFMIQRCIAMTVLCILYAAGLYICSNMFAGITENGTPFRPATASALKKIALILAMSGVLPSFIGTVVSMIINPTPYTGSQGLRVFLSSSNLSVGIVPLFLALFVYIMAIVFSYGCLLQQESDETL